MTNLYVPHAHALYETSAPLIIPSHLHSVHGIVAHLVYFFCYSCYQKVNKSGLTAICTYEI